MVDRLLDPVQRGGLAAAELARLTDVVALALHNTYLLAGLLSVVALGLALMLPARLSPATGLSPGSPPPCLRRDIFRGDDDWGQQGNDSAHT